MHLAAASSDGSVTVHSHVEGADTWDVATLPDCPGGVMSVSWAPCLSSERGADGAPTRLRLATAGCDGKARVHERGARAGEAWHCTQVLCEEGGGATAGSAWLRDVAWCPAMLGEAAGLPSLLLAAGGDDGVVSLWSPPAPPSAAPWGRKQLPRFPAAVWRLSWNTTGGLLAVSCGDNSVRCVSCLLL